MKAVKLKQACAVLGAGAKDLQNLVQFGVVRPERRGGVCWFDREMLVRAKVAFFLREALGAATPFLAEFTEVLFREGVGMKTVRLTARPRGGGVGVEIRVPVGALAEAVDSGMPRAAANADAKRGRKRKGWKEEMLGALAEAGRQVGDVGQEEAARVVRAVRRKRRELPEVVVIGSAKKASTARHR
jgi:hypothetical protein